MTRESRHHGVGGPAASIDLRHTPQRLGTTVPGYGLTPASARERAAVVRAVTHDPRIRQRPMPVVIVTGLIALVALAVWGWQLYTSITEDLPLSPWFWGGLATFLAAAAVCSWAWQLYDVQKAIVMWLAIVVLGLAAALIIVFVLVALKGDGDLDLDLDLDGLLDRITGSSAAQDPIGFADQVVLPLADEALATMAMAGDGALDEGTLASDRGPLAAAVCPGCGTALEGVPRCAHCGWAA